MHLSICQIRASWLLIFLPIALALYDGPDYESLPLDTIFPGPWERNIKAPANKSEISPARVYNVEGDVKRLKGEHAVTLGRGGLVTLEFSENIAGRYRQPSSYYGMF